jgi:ABC-type branched-subunit amino acid transport system substrate-binding protein
MPCFRLKWVSQTIAILLLASAAASCEWFKPARESSKDKIYSDDAVGDLQSSRVFDPTTGEWRTVRTATGKMDTVKWTSLPEDRFPPVTTPAKFPNGGAKEPAPGGKPLAKPSGKAFDVRMMLPFLTQRNTAAATDIDPESRWGIQFYAGAKLAYQALEAAGTSLNITVNDTESSSDKLTTIQRSESSARSDLIIGPYKREQVSQMARFAKENKIPLVVPHTAQMGMTSANPYYIQVNPSLKSHCEAILKHARRRHAREDIVLVVRDDPDEKARLKYFQDASAILEGKREGSKLKEFIVPANLNNISVDAFIRSGRTTVFIVPSWSNEPFVYSLLRQLMMKKSEGDDIVVYGMPMWIDYEQVDFEYYERLNVLVSSASFVDKSNEQVREFNRRFYEAYGTIPTDEAYLGYDIMYFFGTAMNKWGEAFYEKIDRENFSGLRGKFQFQRVVLEPEKHREDLDFVDQMENSFVHILQFKDYHFQPAE